MERSAWAPSLHDRAAPRGQRADVSSLSPPGPAGAGPRPRARRDVRRGRCILDRLPPVQTAAVAAVVPGALRARCVGRTSAQLCVRQPSDRGWPRITATPGGVTATQGPRPLAARWRGPRCHRGAARSSRRRFAPPASGRSRATVSPLLSAQWHRDPCTRQARRQARGWTPRRPPAAVVASEPEEPPGRACLGCRAGRGRGCRRLRKAKAQSPE